MNKKGCLFMLLFVSSLLSCRAQKAFNSYPSGDQFIDSLLQTRPDWFGDILQHRKEWKVQVVYTRIDRDRNNTPSFTTHSFNIDSNDYFYPASTVKMPVALLALQAMHELSLPGLNMNSSLLQEAGYAGQTAVLNDPTSPDGRPTVAQYVRKIFMVSDNDAFNRLYELLGQQYINDRLHKMGYADAEILHRLQISMTADQNRHTNPIRMYDSTGKLLYTQPMLFNQTRYSERHDSVGSGYYSGDVLINRPMDFSGKNRIALADLHNVLRAVLFPQSVPASQRFNFTDDDYRFVKQYMSQLPTESLYPDYASDTANYWPAYCKFLLFGSEKGPLPPNIRIFNKVGDAYGFLTDVAYIVDFEKQTEFMLSARIYCNTDGILNDDKYDYDSIGFPFMKHLGQLIYDYEAKRPRTVKPDLSAFKMHYDK
ncbi:MAG: serine hydrolase [Bacteroidota bacterium]|nr:serine hydrolase [Bacteroidota bacterium]